jgi:hypothetical protein
LKVHCLGRADADEDPQDLDACRSLRHSRLETVAALLDGGEVEACGVCDRLKKVWIGRIGVRAGNRGVLPVNRVGTAWGKVRLRSRSGLWLSSR